MKTEYEATFTQIDKNEIRKRLESVGAKLLKKEFLQKRKTFELPTGHEIKNGWLRVRDESDKITMSLKVVKEDGKIEDQEEIELIVNDFENACELLTTIGCIEMAYQETKREIWKMDGVIVTIDEWPYLEPFVEVEGESEKVVKEISELLKFDYSTAYFGSVTGLYMKKYGITEKRINFETPLILFDMDENPFE